MQHFCNEQSSNYCCITKTKKELNTEKKEAKKEEHTIRQSEVSYQTKQRFQSDFPKASNISYTRNSNIDEVWFIQDNMKYKAFYDADAHLIGTTTPKNVSDLPAVAQKEIEKKYAGYNIDKVILFDDNESNGTDMLLYGQQFAHADNYFIELQKDNKKAILQINMQGEIFYFSNK